jgi:hypothetical protein
MIATRSSMRIRKTRTLFVAGGCNEGGVDNQLNERGWIKDKDHHLLVDLFYDVLKPRGWLLDATLPLKVCANYTFVPASLANIDKHYLYQHGVVGTHYAAE